MKVLVLGTGKIGTSVTADLANHKEVQRVGIVDYDSGALKRARSQINSDKLITHQLDVTQHHKMKEVMAQYDVGVFTLPNRQASYKAVEAGIEAGLNMVDILEEYHRRPDSEETEGLEVPGGMSLEEYGEQLHQKAIEHGVILLDGMGFAPGLSNVTVAEGIRQLDYAESAIARVGGIPTKVSAKRHPLGYTITWAFEHVLREYMIKVKVLKDGQLREVDACSERERFDFTQLGKQEALECAITPGMPSFIFSRPNLLEFAEKTIRWPGHWDGIQTLKECGLLSLTPVQFNGTEIKPRDFLSSLIEPKLRPQEGDTDVCVMWNTVTGSKNDQKMKIDYYLWEEATPLRGMSAMARVTGSTAAIAAVMIGKGEIKKRGIIPPEDGIEGKVYQKLMTELNKRGITILEEITTL